MDTLASNIVAEQGVIGCLLLDPDVVARCDLEPQHFINVTYGRIWASAVQSYRDGIPYTFADAVTDGADLDELMAVQEVSPSPYNLPSYAANVKEAWERRQAQLLAAKLMEQAGKPDTPIEELRQLASAYAMSGVTVDNAVTAWDEIPEKFLADLEYYEQRRASGRMMDWPWASWNGFIDSAEPGMLVVFAAAEGTGKTVYVENIAEHWAKRGAYVGFFHLELNERIMRLRRYARHTGISVGDMRNRTLTHDEQHAVKRAEVLMQQWPGRIDYVHAPGWTMDRIIRTSEIMGFDAVVIDYMQKVQPTAAQMRSSKGDIVRWGPMAVEDFKNYCERTESYAMVLSQLTAEGKNGEPTMNDLRWLKELSEKANVVALAWRETMMAGEKVNGVTITEPGAKSVNVNVKIDKNTMGKQGRLPQQQIEGARFRILDKQK